MRTGVGRLLPLAFSGYLISGCVSMEQGPKAPSISKMKDGMSAEQVATQLGAPSGTYSLFGYECRVYNATTIDGMEEKPHHVLFRGGKAVSWGEGGDEGACLNSLSGK